ncbi:hypothetical protein RFI_20218, partial [Reticulomyxa filosa]
QLEQYANLLLEIGDRKVSQDEVGNALLLYLKGLDLHDHVTTQIQLWLNSYSCILVHTNTSPQTQHNEENTHSDNDDPSSPMTLKTYSQMFSQCIFFSFFFFFLEYILKRHKNEIKQYFWKAWKSFVHIANEVKQFEGCVNKIN